MRVLQRFSPVLLVVAVAPGGLLAQSTAAKPSPTPTRQTPAATDRSTKKSATPGAAAFELLVKQANAAREASRLLEAIELYTKALKLRPRSAEAYWGLGLSNYALDRYQPAREAFRTVADLTPENGDAWTFKGLCEFQLKNYDTALEDLLRSKKMGAGVTKNVVTVARYHIGILFTRNGQFEQAVQMLNGFAVEGNDSPRIIEAMGLATLRLPMLPVDLPGTRRDQVMLAGRANYFHAALLPSGAQRAYEELVTRYPEVPNVHYAYGVFLSGEQPDAAVEQFKAELKVSPSHPWAKIQLAFEYIKRSDWEAARPWAQQAVEEAPDAFVAHRALGQVLLETGDLDGAVREFEMGVRQAPDSPAMRFALARAYRRAGRTADADREQAEFARLDRLLRMQRTGSQSVGGIEVDGAVGGTTTPSPQP
jgi:tetratricopeptide (TPR) repeat protein